MRFCRRRGQRTRRRPCRGGRRAPPTSADCSAAESRSACRRGTRRGSQRGRGTAPGAAPNSPALRPVAALGGPPGSVSVAVWEWDRAWGCRVLPEAAAAAPPSPSVAASRAAWARSSEYRFWRRCREPTARPPSAGLFLWPPVRRDPPTRGARVEAELPVLAAVAAVAAAPSPAARSPARSRPAATSGGRSAAIKAIGATPGSRPAPAAAPTTALVWPLVYVPRRRVLGVHPSRHPGDARDPPIRRHRPAPVRREAPLREPRRMAALRRPREKALDGPRQAVR